MTIRTTSETATTTSSDDTTTSDLATAWAERDADLFVVIGRGATELQHALRDRPGHRQPRLVLAVRPDDEPGDVMRGIDRVTSIPGFLPRRVTVVAHPDEVAAHGESVHRLASVVAQATQRYMVSVNTFAEHARAFLWHTLRNAAWYPGSVSFASLANRARGTPAVIVGAGPSLDDSLDELRDIARHAPRPLIIACDTAAPALLRTGIEPDVIAAIDIHPRKARILRELSAHLPHALLAQQQYCHPRLSHAWHGRRTWMGTPSPAAQLLPSLPAIGETLSVAHAAFEVARHAGCSPIVLVGVDLAFTDGSRTHAANTFGHWGDLEGGGDPPNDEEVLNRPGLDGQAWPTLPAMAAMATGFGQLIANAGDDVEVVNATARGLHIPGARRGSLRASTPGADTPGSPGMVGCSPGADTPGSPGRALEGAELAFDADEVIGALRATADEPPDALVKQAAFAEWFRTRQLSDEGEADARRFVTRACRLAAERLQRATTRDRATTRSNR